MVRLLFILTLLQCCSILMAQNPHGLRVKRQKQGFVVTKEIAGKDVLLAYSETGDFDRAMHLDPLFGKVMNTFEKVSRRAPAPMTHSDNLPEEVKPICTDNWTQDEPYNLFTPMIDSVHCKTGCVANAMAQVMYYYRYPAKGTGTYTYYDGKGCKDTLTADFAAHTYEWDYMLDTYAGCDYSKRQAEAVALLMSDCGISVDMRYGIDASGAQTIKQPFALYNYFGYDRGMRMIYRDFYHRDEVHTLIRRELAAGHPVTCSAHGPDGGGHAFVIDGYDADGLYHINWGWGGWCDGYYNIDYMNPDQPEWNHHRDRIENGLNILQGFVLGIQPPSATPTPETHEYAFSHLELIRDSALVVHNLCNVGWNVHSGRVVLGVTNVENDDLVAIAYDYNREFLLEEFEDTTYTDTIVWAEIAHEVAKLADNTYRLMPMYEDNGQWLHARTSCGTPYYIFIDKTGGDIRPREAKGATGHLELLKMECADTVTRGEYTKVSITLANPNDDEYCGRIFLCQEASPGTELLQSLSRFGLYIAPHTTETIDLDYVYISSRMSDTLRLHVLYDIDLFTDSVIHFDDVKEVIVADKASDIATLNADPSKNKGFIYNVNGQLLPRRQTGMNVSRKRKEFVR